MEKHRLTFRPTIWKEILKVWSFLFWRWKFEPFFFFQYDKEGNFAGEDSNRFVLAYDKDGNLVMDDEDAEEANDASESDEESEENSGSSSEEDLL